MIKKYIKIYKVFIENGISYVTQYRHDNWLNLLIHLLYLGMLFLVIEIIFGQTQTIVGWEKHEVYLLALLWSIVDELFVVFFGANVSRIPDVITDGKLDLIISKPVSSLFMVSTNFFLFRGVYRLLVTLIVLVWLFWQFDFGFSFYHIPLAILLLFMGLIVLYSIHLIAATLSFWFFRISNIYNAIETFSTMGRYPLNVFPKVVKIISLSAIPIGFTAYVPLSILSGRWPLYGFLYAISFTVLIFCLAVKFWKFAVKRYSSASS